MRRAGKVKVLRRGTASAIGVVLLAFLTAASEKSSEPKSAPANAAAANQASAPANAAPTLEEELKSFEEQLVAPSSAESLFANGRAPDLVVVSSTDVHGEIEPCG